MVFSRYYFGLRIIVIILKIVQQPQLQTQLVSNNQIIHNSLNSYQMIPQQQISGGVIFQQQPQHLINQENIIQNTTIAAPSIAPKRNKGGRPSTGRTRNVQGKQNTTSDSKDSFTLGSVIQLLGVSKTGDKASVRFSMDTSNEFAMIIKQCQELKEQVIFNYLFNSFIFSKIKRPIQIN